MATPRILTRNKNGLDNNAPSRALHVPGQTDSTAFPTSDFVTRMIEIVGTELGGIGKEMAVKNKRIGELLEATNAKDERIRDLDSVCTSLKASVKTGKAELAHAVAKLNDTAAGLEEANRARGELVTQCKDLRVALDKEKQTAKPVSTHNEHLEVALRADLGRAKQENRDLWTRCADLTSRNQKLVEAAWKVNKDLDLAQRELQRKDMDIRGLGAKLDEVAQIRVKANRSEWDTKMALRTKDEELRRVFEENAKLRARAKADEVAVARERAIVDELRAQLSKKQRKAKAYRRCRRCAASEGLESESSDSDSDADDTASQVSNLIAPFHHQLNATCI